MKSTPFRSRRAASAGFTLLEILIAIALLAAIAGLLISNLDRVLGGGKKEIAKLFVGETMETPLMSYRVNVGTYPSTELGLEALRKAPGEGVEGWEGPYVKKVSNDPWGKPYQYRYPGEKNIGGYDLWSLGPDGVESADDIGNWEVDEEEKS